MKFKSFLRIKEKKIIKIEDIDALDWDNLINKNLEDKSVFIIPENML